MKLVTYRVRGTTREQLGVLAEGGVIPVLASGQVFEDMNDLIRNASPEQLKAIEKSNAYRLPECLSYYIKHEGSVSSGSKIKLIKWHYKLFREGMGKSPITAGFFTVNNLIHGVWKKIHYKRPVDNN